MANVSSPPQAIDQTQVNGVDPNYKKRPGDPGFDWTSIGMSPMMEGLQKTPTVMANPSPMSQPPPGATQAQTPAAPASLPTATTPSAPSVSGGGGTTLPGFSPITGTNQPTVGASSPTMAAETPTPMGNEVAGTLPLRGQLGNRLYPQESMILAGLKRAY